MPQIPTSYAQSGASGGDMSQTNRFTSAFNPAFSFVVDALASFVDEENGRDGAELHLRALEIASQAWVDPHAWAYFVASADEEALDVEEGALHFTDLGWNSTIRVGRFFIDFGKQMQTHIHELRTIDRPLALRAFLGDEVKGDGVQWDSWTPVGDSTAVRWSLGVFGNLLPESADEENPSPSVEERKDLGDLNFTGRVTGFTDVGENGTLQLGVSARALPNFTETFTAENGDETQVADLESSVYGADITYGWVGDTGLERLTLGGEYLLNLGDTTPKLDDAGLLTVDDPRQDGLLAFVDYQFNPYHSVGAQWSRAELPLDGGPSASEYDVYYSRMFSEFHRLRFAITRTDIEDDADSTRFAIQYTAFVGAHGHGVNW